MAEWKELSRNDWTIKFLTDLFKGATIGLQKTEGATMSFFRVEVNGDCALAVKSSFKPRPMFELKMELDWKVEQPVDNGKSIAEAKGQIQVTDFSSEDISAPQMKLICDNQLPPGATPAFQGLITKLNDAVKANGMPEVSRMLAEDFVTALIESATPQPAGAAMSAGKAAAAVLRKAAEARQQSSASARAAAKEPEEAAKKPAEDAAPEAHAAEAAAAASRAQFAAVAPEHAAKTEAASLQAKGWVFNGWSEFLLGVLAAVGVYIYLNWCAWTEAGVSPEGAGVASPPQSS